MRRHTRSLTLDGSGKHMLGLCSLASGSPQHFHCVIITASCLWPCDISSCFLPDYKNAEHANIFFLFFLSRIALFNLQSLTQMTLGFQEATSNTPISTIYSEEGREGNLWYRCHGWRIRKQIWNSNLPISSWGSTCDAQSQSRAQNCSCNSFHSGQSLTWLLMHVFVHAWLGRLYSYIMMVSLKCSVTLPYASLLVVSLINTRCQ